MQLRVVFEDPMWPGSHFLASRLGLGDTISRCAWGLGLRASSLWFGALGFCVYGLRIRVEA